MSCHSTSGGIVSTSLARAVTGLSEKEIQHVFHALKREAQGMPSPSELDVQAWRTRQYDLLQRMKRMSDTRRDKLRDRLFRSRSESVPDGATFYAWSTVEARARQEAALREIGGALDLEPPGSQAHMYDLGEDGRPTRVWYASYGSNLHRDRFMNYIEGGSPEGSTRTYDGCTDPTPPASDIPIRFAGARPHFALTSRVWRGGIAFIDAQKGESAHGLGRAYDISIDQFDEVVAQENGLPTKLAGPVPLEEALTTGRSVIGNGSYETILHIGDYNGAPVLTFTAPFSTREALTKTGNIVRQANPQATPVRMPVMTNKPSPAYLRMIGSGLGETFEMDEVQQADYLRGCPGGDRWSRQQMVRILRGQDPDLPRATGPENPAAPEESTSSTSTSGAKVSSIDSKRRSAGRGTAAQFSHQQGTSTGRETREAVQAADASVLADLRERGLFPASELQNRYGRTGKNTSGRASADAGSTPGRGGSGRRQGEQPRSTVQTRRTDTGQRELPRVKTYRTADEKQVGVSRWQKTVVKYQKERDSIQGSINALERGKEAQRANGASDAALDATQRNLDTAYARRDEANRVLNQAESRLATARAQTPARFYGPGRTLTQWREEDERVLAIHRTAETTYDQKRAELARLSKDAPQEKRDNLTRHVARMREVLTEAEARLQEIHEVVSKAKK